MVRCSICHDYTEEHRDVPTLEGLTFGICPDCDSGTPSLGPIKIPQDLFLKLAVMVCRAVVMLERVRQNLATGPDAAKEIDDSAYMHAQRVHELFQHMDEDQREDFATVMGWPAAAGLATFLSEGVKEGGEH